MLKTITPRTLRHHAYRKTALKGVFSAVLANRHAAWARAFVSMPMGGDALERNTEVLTTVPVEDSTFEILFGRHLPTKTPTDTERSILAELVRSGLTATPTEIATRLEVSDRHVRRIRQEWGPAINELLGDLAYLDMKGSDVHDAICNSLLAKPLLDGLAEARLHRPTLLGLGQNQKQYTTTIAGLWREYREAKAYQGASPDDFELSPPRWFVIQELEIAPKATANA